MSKKNRKNNKNKKVKGKESDGRGSSTGDGSNNDNNNNNNNHNNHNIHNNNNNTIPTVVDEMVVATSTSSTMVLTQTDLEHVNNICKLKGYPRSNYFVVGYRAMKAETQDLAIDAFKRGADNEGCVPCIAFYAYIQHQRGNLYLLLPYAFEGVIRGYMPCMNYLIDCYQKTQPILARALASLWLKMKIELGDTEHTEERRKEIKKKMANKCQVCGKEESQNNNDVTIVQCGICKFYAYCGKNCQTYHWKELKHMNECRQVILLRKYCKPHYVKEIREAIIGGQDPKEIDTLQRLRTKLGLNRPKEEYEELLSRLGDDIDSTIQDRYHYLTARKDGTVHIGSTTNVI